MWLLLRVSLFVGTFLARGKHCHCGAAEPALASAPGTSAPPRQLKTDDSTTTGLSAISYYLARFIQDLLTSQLQGEHQILSAVTFYFRNI